MIDFTKRTVSVSPGRNQFMAIVALFVTATNTGCSIVEQFVPEKSSRCSCGQYACDESIASCNTAAASGMNSSAPMVYPQELPIVDRTTPSGLRTPDEMWAPRHVVKQPAGYTSCETQLQEAREDFDDKLASLEARFVEEHRANNAINGQLQVLHGNVEQLSDDVNYWKDEVRRIGQTGEEHHRSDMENMRSLSRLIDEIAPEAGSGSQIPETRTQ